MKITFTNNELLIVSSLIHRLINRQSSIVKEFQDKMHIHMDLPGQHTTISLPEDWVVSKLNIVRIALVRSPSSFIKAIREIGGYYD